MSYASFTDLLSLESAEGLIQLASDTGVAPWNAATNIPPLANGTGNAGDTYIVSAAGSINFGSGPLCFNIGDYLYYNGTVYSLSASPNMFASMIAKADSLIDDVLRGHIEVVPILPPVPPLITELSAELAITNLYKRHMGGNVPDAIVARRREARQTLQLIADGKINLSDVDIDEEPESQVRVKTDRPIYSRRMLNRFQEERLTLNPYELW